MTLDHLLAKTITVPWQLDPNAKPNACSVSVARLIKERGGELVTGWIVRERDYWFVLLHHACWRDSEGNLWHTTPQIEQDGYDLEQNRVWSVGEPIHFLLDPDAHFIDGRGGLHTRYISKIRNKYTKRYKLVLLALKYLTISEQRYYLGDKRKGEKYTKLANETMKQAGIGVAFEPPQFIETNYNYKKAMGLPTTDPLTTC